VVSPGDTEVVSGGAAEREPAGLGTPLRLFMLAVIVLVASVGVSYRFGVARASRQSSVPVPAADQPRIIPIPGGHPSGGGVAAGSIWVMTYDGYVVRVNPNDDSVDARIRVGQGPLAVRAGFGSVWVTNGEDGTVTRIDPATNKVVGVIPVGPVPYELAPAGGGMWVATQTAAVRIDPATNLVDLHVTLPLPPQTVAPDTAGVGLAADEHGVWVSTAVGTVLRLSPTDGRLLAEIRILPDNHTQPGAVALDGDLVWVSNFRVTGTGAGTPRYGEGLGVVAISAASNQIVQHVSSAGYPISGLLPHNGTVFMVGEIYESNASVLMRADWPYQVLTSLRPVGGRSFDVLAAAGSLWVPSWDANELYRLPPSG
jgi:YVTN family beta-propeller protein